MKCEATLLHRGTVRAKFERVGAAKAQHWNHHHVRFEHAVGESLSIGEASEVLTCLNVDREGASLHVYDHVGRFSVAQRRPERRDLQSLIEEGHVAAV